MFSVLKRLVTLIGSSYIKFKNTFYGGEIILGRNTKFIGSKIIAHENSKLLLGSNTRAAGRCHFEANRGTSLIIGDGTTFNYGCQVYGDVHISAGCTLASEVYISSMNHSFKKKPYLPIKMADKLFPEPSQPIFIEEDVWLGKNVFIRPGIYIAKGCIVGSNQIVTKSIFKPYTIHINSFPLKQRKRFDFRPLISFEVSEEIIPYLYRGFRLQEGSKMRAFCKKGILTLGKVKKEERIKIVVDNILFIESISKNFESAEVIIEDRQGKYKEVEAIFCDSCTLLGIANRGMDMDINMLKINANEKIEFYSLETSTNYEIHT